MLWYIGLLRHILKRRVCYCSLKDGLCNRPPFPEQLLRRATSPPDLTHQPTSPPATDRPHPNPVDSMGPCLPLW